MDSALLLDALQFIDDAELPLDSLTVVRHGHIVLDVYYYPYTPDRPHQLWSATKSVTATLVGIAIDRGLIDSVDQPIIELFPQFAPDEVNLAARSATVADFLAMSSGISCSSTFRNECAAMDSGDATAFVADLLFAESRPTYPPYRRFEYCDLNSCLLLGAIQNSIDKPLWQFADEVLFEPLEITNYTWWTDDVGMPLGSFGLHLTPHDMAHIGALYLNGGVWNGQRLVSQAWVDFVRCADPSRCPFYDAENRTGYGYHWWLFKPSLYAAVGLGGQFIAVAPAIDMVVVVTSYGSTSEQVYESIPYELIEGRILAAAVSDTELPADDAVHASLRAAVERAAMPSAAPRAPLPDIAFDVSGMSFHLLRPIHTSFWPAKHTVSVARPCALVGYGLSFMSTNEGAVTFEYEDESAMTLRAGLDGVWRVTPTDYGEWAARGSWDVDEAAFHLSTQLVGGAERHEFVFHFADDRPILRWIQPEALHLGATDVMRAVPREP
ncbi:MAG: serine hydrolase [Chloroflexi bacterium]|nr:serine hydrolase [Chloroflexota bacterium]